MKQYFSILILMFICFLSRPDMAQAQCPSIGGSVTGGTTLCRGQSTSVLLRVEGYRGAVLRWESSIDNGGTWIQIAHRGVTFTPPLPTRSTLFRAIIRQAFCTPAASRETQISIVDNIDAAIISSLRVGPSQTVCNGQNPTTLQLTSTPTLPSDVRILRWESSLDSLNWTTVTNTTSSFAPVGVNATTWFRAVVQRGTCNEVRSAPARILVPAAANVGTIIGDFNGCAPRNSGTLTLTGFTGVVDRWQSGTFNETSGTFTWTDIPSSNNPIFTYRDRPAGTYYFRAEVSTSNCPEVASPYVTIVISPPSVPGQAQASVGDAAPARPLVTICGGVNQQRVTLSLTGQTGEVLFWESRAGEADWPTTVAATNTLTNSARTSLVLPNLNSTTQYRARLKSGNCKDTVSAFVNVKVEGRCCEAPSGLRAATPSLFLLEPAGTPPTNVDNYNAIEIGSTWTAPPTGVTVTGYEVWLKEAGAAPFAKIGTDPTATNTGRDQNVVVRDGICYQMYVRPKCNTPSTVVPGRNINSDTLEFCVCIPINTNTFTATLSGDTAKLAWFDRSSASRYAVEYRSNGGAWISDTVTTQIANITGLTCQTAYEFRVTKICSTGNGNFDTFEYGTKTLTIDAPCPPACDDVNFNWARFGGSAVENEIGRSVTTGPDGFVYVTGGFRGNANFGSFTLNSADPNRYDIFVVKYDPFGTPVWAQRIGSGNNQFNEVGSSIYSDEDGNLYLTGQFYGAAAFGNRVLTARGDADIFLSRINPADGTVLWTTTAGGTSTDLGFGVSTDAFGNPIITGSVTGNATFGTTTLRGSATNTDAFVAKYSADGSFIWARRGGNPTRNDLGRSIVGDDQGNVYIAGSYTGSDTDPNAVFESDVNGLPVLVFNDRDQSPQAFVAKYNVDGAVLWVRPFESSNAQAPRDNIAFSEGSGLDLDSRGNVYVSGWFRNTLALTNGAQTIDVFSNFGSGIRETTVDFFVARLNANGAPIWLKNGGSPNRINGNAISSSLVVDNRNNIFVAGSFDANRLEVDGDDIITGNILGDVDGFVIQFTPNGEVAGNATPVALRLGGDDFADVIQSIDVDSRGIGYITGNFRGRNLFTRADDQRNEKVLLNSIGDSWDAYLAQFSCSPLPSCGSITDVFASNIGNNSVAVNWTFTGAVDPGLVTGSEQFIVRWRDLDAGSTTWQVSEPVTAAPFVINNLFAGRRYEVQVAVTCQVGDIGGNIPAETPFSEPTRFETLPVAVCGQPINVQVDNVFENAAIINWQTVAGAAFYEVSWRVVESTDPWVEIVPRTLTNSVRINGLPRDSRIEVRVRSVCRPNLFSNYSFTRFFTLDGTCPAAPNVRISGVTPNSAVVNWTEIPQAIGYRLQWKETSNPTWANTVTISAPANNYNIVGLLNKVEYEVRILTICGAGRSTSPFSEPTIKFTTGTACATPFGLRELNIEATRTKVTWNAVTSAVSYDIQYKLVASDQWQGPISSDINEISLVDLQPCVGYQYRVRANCGGDNITVYSSIKDFRTTCFCPAPESLAVSNISFKGFTLAWQPANVSVNGYVIQRRIVGDPWSTDNETTVIRPTFVDTTLMSNTCYEYRVRALCSDGSFSDYTSASFCTPECTAPLNLIVDGITITESSATVRWDAVPGISQYRVIVERGATVVSDRVTTQNVLILTDLAELTVYTVRVVVVCPSGALSSNVVEFTTSRLCGTPQDVRVVFDQTTDSQIALRWTAVSGATLYRVFYREVGRTPYNLGATSTLNTAVVGGLRADTEYELYVTASCASGNRDAQSAIVTERTRTQTDACPTPSLSSINVQRTSATISWTLVDNATAYDFGWRVAGSGSTWITVTRPPSVNTFTIINLSPGTVYEIRVRARCQSTVTDYSFSTFTTTINRTGDITTDGPANLSLYPNPASDQLNISLEALGEQNAVLRLTDLAGKEVLTQSYDLVEGKNTLNLNVEGLARSVYFLSIDYNLGVQRTKVVLE
jgi:hypothetical protein